MDDKLWMFGPFLVLSQRKRGKCDDQARSYCMPYDVICQACQSTLLWQQPVSIGSIMDYDRFFLSLPICATRPKPNSSRVSCLMANLLCRSHHVGESNDRLWSNTTATMIQCRCLTYAGAISVHGAHSYGKEMAGHGPRSARARWTVLDVCCIGFYASTPCDASSYHCHMQRRCCWPFHPMLADRACTFFVHCRWIQWVHRSRVIVFLYF